MSAPLGIRSGVRPSVLVVCVTSGTSSSSLRYWMPTLIMQRASCASGGGWVRWSAIGSGVAGAEDGGSIGPVGEQARAAGKPREQDLLDDRGLADDPLAQLGENALAALRDFFSADRGDRRIHVCP